MNKFLKSILMISCLIGAPAHSLDSVESPQNNSIFSSLTTSFKQRTAQVGYHLQFLLMPTEEPTWRSALYKASVGVTLSLTGLVIDENNMEVDPMGNATIHPNVPQAACYFLSCRLLFDAAGDVLYLAYNHLRSPVISAIANKNKNKIRRASPHLTDTEIRNLVAEKEKRNLAYMARIGRYLFNSAGIAHGIYLYITQLNEFSNNDVNPFAFSFPEEYPDCPSSTLLCRPVVTPIFLTLYMATLVYNLRELSFCTNPASFIERGDVPFFAFFNGYGKIGLSRTITGRLRGINNATLENLANHKKAYEQYIKQKFGMLDVSAMKNFAESFKILDENNQLDRNAANYSGMQNVAKLYENYLQAASRYEDYATQHQHQLSGLNWLLPLFLRNYGNYQLYESALLTLKNLICYLKDLPVIEVMEGQPVPSVDILQPKDSVKTKKYINNKNTNDIQGITNNSSSHFQEGPREYSDNVKSDRYVPPSSKPKVKRRGVQNSNFLKSSESNNKGKQKTPNPPIDPKLAQRNEGLEHVKDLRKQYPVKVTEVESAIRQLKKFLNAESEPVDGNEYRLVWRINGKRYAIKYEIPHGWDNSNYAGNKLNRILNILEVGYLVGLSEGQINAYITENERYNLLRFPKFLCYLALNPAR